MSHCKNFYHTYTIHSNFRYASLYFCCAVEQSDNELVTLEIIHRYVELLDKYFGSVSFNGLIEKNIVKVIELFFVIFQVCELDIIFNFEKAYFMLDELLLGGEVQETSKKNVLKAIAAQDLLQEVNSSHSLRKWITNNFLSTRDFLWNQYLRYPSLKNAVALWKLRKSILSKLSWKQLFYLRTKLISRNRFLCEREFLFFPIEKNLQFDSNLKLIFLLLVIWINAIYYSNP